MYMYIYVFDNLIRAAELYPLEIFKSELTVSTERCFGLIGIVRRYWLLVRTLKGRNSELMLPPTTSPVDRDYLKKANPFSSKHFYSFK